MNPDSSVAVGSGALCGVNGRNDCGAFLLCDTALGCVECQGDNDCPASAQRCLQGMCVGCVMATTDAGSPDCPGSTCWATDDACHPACAATSACPANSTCDTATGACLGCGSTADCASGVCSAVTHRCEECAGDVDCSATAKTPRCRVLTGTCEACVADTDCGHAAPICDPTTFTCRVGCTTDAQCPGQACDAPTARCVDVHVDAGNVTDAAGDADASGS